jgi:hypothetical protein
MTSGRNPCCRHGFRAARSGSERYYAPRSAIGLLEWRLPGANLSTVDHVESLSLDECPVSLQVALLSCETWIPTSRPPAQVPLIDFLSIFWVPRIHAR